MTNKKSTKRALLMSVLSLFLCVAMLAGTTFAWFTDSVSSKNNVITTGNLDIELEYKKVEKGVLSPEWETVGGRVDIFDPDAYWEPGRVEVVYLKVSNLGSLALKYQLGVNVVKDNPGTNVDGDTFYLSEHLVFKTVLIEEKDVGTYTRATAVEDGDTLGFKDYNGKTTALEVGGADYVAMIVYMPETVGNVANHKKSNNPQNPAEYAASIEFGINLFATQYSVEQDSYGPDYDEDAWHPDMIVYNVDDLKAAVSNGGKVQLGASVVLPETIEIPAGVSTVVNLNGYDLTGANETVNVLKNGGELTIIGKGTITTRNMYNATGAKLVIDGDITINGGAPFAGSAIWNEGDAVIRGVTINQNNTTNYAVQHYNNGTLTLDDVTVNGQHGGVAVHNGTVTIKGGTFTNANEQHAGHTLYVTGGEVIVEGGTFTHDQENASAHGNALIYTTNGTVTINGGTFDSKYAALAYTGMNVTITAGTFANKGASVYQQTTNEGISEFVAAGYKAVANNGKYVVVSDTIANENVVGTPAELESALSGAADAGSGDNTLYLTGDIDLSGSAWTPISVDGYHGAGVITIEGNGATIKGLDAPLFAGGFAGKSGIVIKNLTIADSNIVGGTQGGGAFIDCADSMHVITLENCHLVNSTVSGERAGGLIGWVSGYAELNDGPVKAYVTVSNCSVVDSTVIGNGSAGAIAGHPGASDYTYTTIEDCLIKNVDVISYEPISSWRTGAIVGTANNGHVVINNVTVEDVTLTQDGVTAEETKLYGRFVPSGTGTLVIDGAYIIPTAEYLRTFAASATGDVKIILANDITLGNDTTQKKTGAYFPNATKVTIDGNKKTLTMKGQMEGHDCVDEEYAAIVAPNAVVTVKDVTIVNEKLCAEGTEYSADRESVYTMVRGTSVLFDTVTFNGGVQVKNNTKFLSCTFNEDCLVADGAGYATNGKFCVFVDFEYQKDKDAVCTVDFEGCTFNASGYGCVKLAGDGGATITANVKGCTFTNTCPSNSWSTGTPKYDVKCTGVNTKANDLGENNWAKGLKAN